MTNLSQAKSDSASFAKTMKPLITKLGLVLAFLPILITPPLMDETYWFIQGPFQMDFSPRNIPEFAAVMDQPGRIMPLSSYFRAVHSFLGFTFSTELHLPIELFQLLTHALFLFLLFATFKYFLKSFSSTNSNGLRLFSNQFASQIALTAALVFGVGSNIRWAHNGLVAYVPMTYAPIITALAFAGCTVRLLRSRSVRGAKSFYTRLVAIGMALSLWANYFYELAYMAVALTVFAVLAESLLVNQGRIRKLHTLTGLLYISLFSAIWIPTRIYLAFECQKVTCYEGSQLHLSGALSTFGLNLINPLPLTGLSQDVPDNVLGDYMTVKAAAFIALALLIIFWATYTAIKELQVIVGELDAAHRKGILLILGVLPLLVGVFSALIMSVSSRAQRLVSFGDPYRQAPTLWLAYVSLAIAILVWIAFRTQSRIIPGLVLIIMVPILSTQFVFSMANTFHFQSSFKQIHKLYDEITYPDKNSVGNIRRCALESEMATSPHKTNYYLEPSNAYFEKYFGVPFCSDVKD